MVHLAMVSTAYLEAYSYHGALRETTGARVVVESREAVGLLRLGLLVHLALQTRRFVRRLWGGAPLQGQQALHTGKCASTKARMMEVSGIWAGGECV